MRDGGDFRRTLRLFARFTVGQRRAFVFAALLLALSAVTAVAVPDLIKILTDYLVSHRPPTVAEYELPATHATDHRCIPGSSNGTGVRCCPTVMFRPVH